MRTGRPIPPLKITASEREALERWARGHDRRLASRAAAVLACADGLSNKEVAARCAMTKQTVGKWRARFRSTRLQGLYDEPRPGAPRRITEEQVARVIRLTAERAPNGSAWTTRSMAQAVGLTQTAISRIWRTRGVKPAVLAAGANGNGAADPPRDHAPSAAPSDANEDAPAHTSPSHAADAAYCAGVAAAVSSGVLLDSSARRSACAMSASFPIAWMCSLCLVPMLQIKLLYRHSKRLELDCPYDYVVICSSKIE